MPGKNIRLAEEPKRCLFMYGRERRSRWCSRLLSHFLAKLGIALLCAERKGARGGCEKVCGPHPGRSQSSKKEGSVLVTVAYHFVLGFSLRFCLFVYSLSIVNWRDDFISKMLAVQAWEPRFRFLAFVFFKAVTGACTQNAGGGLDEQISGVHWPARLANQRTSDSVSILG